MKFYMPARLSFHDGITPDFTGLLDNSRKTLFVVSGTLIQDRPELLDLLPEGTETYSEAGSNPDIANLQAVPIDGSIRQVVGLGGGSKLDAAKILFARALLEDRYSLQEIIGEPALLDAAAEKRSEYKLIQLPTTFGSSSEITKWGTVWDWEGKRKYSVSHDLHWARYPVTRNRIVLERGKQRAEQAVFPEIHRNLP
jgi:alcohol dehydrogenase class IV